MSNATEQARIRVEAQKAAMREVSAFFAPYIEVAKRLEALNSWSDEKGLRQEFFLDTDPDNEVEGTYSFKSAEYERYTNEWETAYLSIPEALLNDPVGYEGRVVREHEEKQRKRAADELRYAKARLETAQRQLEKAEKDVETKAALASE